MDFSHTLYKTGAQGAAQEPPQDFSNGGDINSKDANLTAGNAITLAVAVKSGVQVIKTGFGAVVDQIGSARLEEALSNTSKISGYVVIGAVSNPFVALGAAGVEVATRTISRAVEVQDITFDNEYKKAIRGYDTSLGGRYG